MAPRAAGQLSGLAGALPRFAGTPAPTGTVSAMGRARTLWERAWPRMGRSAAPRAQVRSAP